MFCDSFSGTYKNNFSYDGKRALFDYLESMEEDIGEKIELDTIVLCCEYSEYDSALEASNQYDEDIEDEALARAYLESKTQVINLPNGGVIIQNF